jgi:carboxypeptidase C (cathepsin A)
VSFFEDGVIYPYFYVTREQRQYLYSIASSIARETECTQRYRFCNGCLILTDYTGRTLDQRVVWRMILECVAASSKHQDCLQMLANVVIQRVLCRLQHSKDVITYVYELTDELFGDKKIKELQQ